MREKQRGSRMGEENISALGIKLAVFVWGNQSGLRSTSLSTRESKNPWSNSLTSEEQYLQNKGLENTEIEGTFSSCF